MMLIVTRWECQPMASPRGMFFQSPGSLSSGNGFQVIHVFEIPILKNCREPIELVWIVLLQLKHYDGKILTSFYSRSINALKKIRDVEAVLLVQKIRFWKLCNMKLSHISARIRDFRIFALHRPFYRNTMCRVRKWYVNHWQDLWRIQS